MVPRPFRRCSVGAESELGRSRATEGRTRSEEAAKKGARNHGATWAQLPLHEHEIDRHDQADAGGEVVPVELLTLENQGGEKDEDHEGDDLLNDFQLHEGKGTAVLLKTDAVGGHLGAIFEESDAPGEKDDADEGPVGGHFHLLELEMPIPGKRHEHIGEKQKCKGLKNFHNKRFTNNFSAKLP